MDNYQLLENLDGAFDSIKNLGQLSNTTCEESISRTLRYHPNYLPPTWKDTGYWACKADPGLCCFHPNDPTDGKWLEEAFMLVEAGEYIYRFHYVSPPVLGGDRHKTYDRLSMVFRICKHKNRCTDGETPPAIDYPGPDTTNSTSAEPKSTSTKQLELSVSTISPSIPDSQMQENSKRAKTVSTTSPSLSNTKDNSFPAHSSLSDPLVPSTDPLLAIDLNKLDTATLAKYLLNVTNL